MENKEQSSTPLVGSPHSSVSSDTEDSYVIVDINSPPNKAHNSSTTYEGSTGEHGVLTQNEEKIQKESNKDWVQWKEVLQLDTTDTTTVLQCEVCGQYFEAGDVVTHFSNHSKADRLTTQQQQHLMDLDRPRSSFHKNNTVSNVTGHVQEQRGSLISGSPFPRATPSPNPILTPPNSINNSCTTSSSEEQEWSRPVPYNNNWPNYERQASNNFTYSEPSIYNNNNNSHYNGAEYGHPFNPTHAFSNPHSMHYDSMSQMTHNYQFGQHQYPDWNFAHRTNMQSGHFFYQQGHNIWPNTHSLYPYGPIGHHPNFQNTDFNCHPPHLNLWPQVLVPYPTSTQHSNYLVMEPQSSTSNHPSLEFVSPSTDHHNYRERVEELEPRTSEQETPSNPVQGESMARNFGARDDTALPTVTPEARQSANLRPTDRSTSEHGVENPKEQPSRSTPSFPNFQTLEDFLKHLREQKYQIVKQRRDLHICQYCLQTFKSAELLRQHELERRVRTAGLSPNRYFCEFCNTTFDTGQGVVEHEQRSHKIFRSLNIRYCHTCCHRYSSQNALHTHQKRHN